MAQAIIAPVCGLIQAGNSRYFAFSYNGNLRSDEEHAWMVGIFRLEIKLDVWL